MPFSKHFQRADYLHAICEKAISLGDLRTFTTGLSGYDTANPVHANKVKRAVDKLREFLDNPEPARPLNNLILGPPGSGKNYLAELLQKTFGAEPLQFNLSQYESPEQIKKVFRQISFQMKKEPKRKVIVFIDEFDVRVGGIAATQYLIQPMFDGKDDEGNDLKRVAFIFSGSYLRDESILRSAGGGPQGFDLAGFLYDWVMAADDPTVRNLLSQIGAATTQYHPIRQQNLPNVNVQEYVKSLEKIVDFVSRIDGFVVELPDLSSPLDATRGRYDLELKSAASRNIRPNPGVARELMELVDDLRIVESIERFQVYLDPDQPILEYKNLILMDRLVRLITMLRGEWKGRGKSGPVKIRRSTLNYLVTVPLVNGMRSLKTIVGTVDFSAPERKAFPSQDVLQRHISQFHYYPTPDAIWTLITSQNKETFKNTKAAADDTIEVS